MAAQRRRVLVPRLDDRFEEPVIDVARPGMAALLKNMHKLSEVSCWEAMFL